MTALSQKYSNPGFVEWLKSRPYQTHRGDTPLSMLYCLSGEYRIGTDVLLTTIYNINVRRDVRESLSGGRVALGLMAGAKSWSKARGVAEILLHVTSGIDLSRTHKFAKWTGFEFFGGSYVGK